MSNLAQNRQKNRDAAGRDVCGRCLRPRVGCYCAHITPLDTKTRLVLLQHPREREVAIGTAHMASLCLTNSELHVGIDWSRSEPLARALSNPSRPPILLYPGEGSIDIVASPPPGPVTLVVIDGTWSQTKKVVRVNPLLAALPRYAFVPPAPSEYRIRKEPDDASVATIEALVHALAALEGDASRFEALLSPFRAMIDFQITCQQQFHSARLRHAKHRARPKRMRVPRALTDRFEDIVCIAAEANSWPYPVRDSGYADELVLWAAHRPATGETLSFVVAPRAELAPGTTIHTKIDAETLRAGGTLAELHARWRGFTRESDVICSWGKYETHLFTTTGGWLPGGHVDLRRVARDVTQGAVGSLAEYRDRVGPDHSVERGAQRGPSSEAADEGATTRLLDLVPGRAGHKMRALVEIVASLRKRVG